MTSIRRDIFNKERFEARSTETLEDLEWLIAKNWAQSCETSLRSVQPSGPLMDFPNPYLVETAVVVVVFE